VGAQLHHLTTVTSTLDLLHEFAGRGAPHGTVVVADEQLEGRGTRGRTWHSPPGGLWYSILLRDVALPAVSFLSLRIGIAVANVIEVLVAGARIELKWPNDLMLGDRKIGGVLCEARWQGASLAWIAVGIGLNVTNRIPAELEGMAAALGSVDPELRPDVLIPPITETLRQLEFEGEKLSEAELAEWRKRDWLWGRPLREPLQGVARGIDRDGALIVERADATLESLRAGHVVLA
jgi:BirA family transcriptional regulator, biotin operon repressor / biotin---[acetyl-CoA-carboxylase] ligase